MQEDKKNRLVGWLNDALIDRDRFMTSIIEVTFLQYQGLKGIFFGGVALVNKSIEHSDGAAFKVKVIGKRPGISDSSTLTNSRA